MIRYDLSHTDASHNAIITVLSIVGFGLILLSPAGDLAVALLLNISIVSPTKV